MGPGEYICVTLRGGAPWGFGVREGDGDTYTPFQVYQVREDGAAFSAGVRDYDEVVSINGEPCEELHLPEALYLINSSTDCLQLLLKRYGSSPTGSMDPDDEEEEEEEVEVRYRPTTSPRVTLESTTLHILSASRPHPAARGPGDLYVSKSPDGGGSPYYGAAVRDPDPEEGQPPLRCFAPGAAVELRLSLPPDPLECTSLGSALGMEGLTRAGQEAPRPSPEDAPHSHTSTHSLYVPAQPPREPVGQRGVVLRQAGSAPGGLGQVEFTLQPPVRVGGGPGAGGSVGSRGKAGAEGGGGHREGAPPSFSVSFGVPSEEAGAVEERDRDSEGDPDEPNKHHARHARLRRNESLSEKQVKEAKSKCKRIALLLSAAPPNPNNKGLLMFKKHRQRAKKYTLVSYGTGESEPESDGEDDGDEDGEHTVEFTLLATSDADLDGHFFTDTQTGKGVLTINWDKGLLEIERILNNPEEMECLPDTKGKGAVMFAQRRMRMDEITAEHEEMRRQGIPVEGLQESETKASYQQVEEHSYRQSTNESSAYTDVAVQQQQQQQEQQQQEQQQQQEYQQYQERQYYEQQQQQYQQQQHQQQQQLQQQQEQHQQQQQQQLYQQQQQQQQQQQLQYEQHYQQQQQQYEQQQYLQQQSYQQQQHHQQQEYQQQQVTQYAATNGTVHHQTNEVQSSYANHTAKPFSVEQMTLNPYSPAMSGTNRDPNSQGEEIASRDERIATPAIRTGVLQDTRKRSTMFTFKEAPKVSPNPVLLNLLNRNEKKGFEYAAEEDFLSLGAEACNFLQSTRVKHKTPPPVAPKPIISPTSLSWPQQIELTNQDQPELAENSVPAPAVAPPVAAAPAPEPEPNPAPAAEPSPPPAPRLAAANNHPPDQEPTWIVPEPQSKPQPQFQPPPPTPPQLRAAYEEDGTRSSPTEPPAVPVKSWVPASAPAPVPAPAPAPVPSPVPAQQHPAHSSWGSAQVQPQEPAPRHSPSPLPWVTPQPPRPQVQPSPVRNDWAPPQSHQQAQPAWSQPQELYQPQTNNAPAALSRPQEKSPPLTNNPPPWLQPPEQSPPRLVQQPWNQPQQQMQGQPWAQQPQPNYQPQQPWGQQGQLVPQAQPPWLQQAVPQQAWPQGQGHPQPPWLASQPQQQLDQMNAWPPSQPQQQAQPPWMQAAQTQPQAPLNPWAPVPAQAPPQPTWAQQPQDPAQPPMHPWGPEHSHAQPQQPLAQPVPAPSPQQPNWQQPPPQQPQPEPPLKTWSPAQAAPLAPAPWGAAPSQATHAHVSAPVMRVAQSSPKPGTPQNDGSPTPPQPSNPYTFHRRSSSPINPMATVLIPSASSHEMPCSRGKGADLFAKRQSRMERFIVDSESVQANKESRCASPVASLPTEWKYSSQVRAPPPLAYNPIQSPSYPPAAIKQPPPSSPKSKAKKKEKEKPKPAPKPLNVIEVMRHQPYQLMSSLFTYGPAAEAAEKAAAEAAEKAAAHLAANPNPPMQNAPMQYEQMAPVQYPGPMNAPYPQQMYGMPPHQFMQEGQYQQAPMNPYAPPNPYQQAPGGPYYQPYPPQYQQAPPNGYQPQSPSQPYQQTPQGPYPPASNPPYQPAPYQPTEPATPSVYVAPGTPLMSRQDSASGSSNAVAAAPKPRFMAKKASAQVWKPSAGGDDE